jgi:hypothetical protein
MTAAAKQTTTALIALAVLALPHTGWGQQQVEVPVPKGMQNAFVQDPVLNMDAFEVFYPQKWHFQGTVVQGTSCFPVPFVVFRASSPDGLTVLEKLPRLDWRWGTAPGINQAQRDCLPLKQTLSAQELLKNVSATMNLEYLSDVPPPADLLAAAQKGAAQAKASMAAQYASSGMTPPVETIQMARATVRYKNGSFVMKGLLSATVDCTESTLKGPMATWVTNSCNASVRYVHAPEAQYQAALTLLDPSTTGAFGLSNWSQAWIANNQRQTQANLAQIRAQGQAAMAQTRASAQQFQHSQDVRQHMHEEFLSTMQRGTDMSMNRSAQIANSNHTMASDWVDYSLDQQTVRDPASGQVSKVSSQYSYTWVDSSGKLSYQTNDVNANPNGALQGNWSRQQVVHGDGTSP